MSYYTQSNNELLVGDFVIKKSGLPPLIDVMNNSGYAVNVLPINDERVRVIITETKNGFYD